MPRLASVLLLFLLALAGCGGGGDGDAERPDRRTPSTPKAGDGEAELSPGGASSRARPRSGPVTKAERAVIRGWADALRHGDVARATGYWRVPAIAANGGQRFRLLTLR